MRLRDSRVRIFGLVFASESGVEGDGGVYAIQESWGVWACSVGGLGVVIRVVHLERRRS